MNLTLHNFDNYVNNLCNSVDVESGAASAVQEIEKEDGREVEKTED